jgi:3-hydroxyacyl-CoA dehydrogenase/enoyl-CoA hydratase/3-hydroxybutyryl-CoA epimerase
MHPGTAQVFMAGTAMTAKATQHNYPAPVAILSCVFEGTIVPIDLGLRIESKYFTSLFEDPVARNMVRTLFVNKQAADKLARRPEGVEKSSVTRLGMLGAGMMGAGIAHVSAMAGIDVVLLDTSDEKAEKGKDYSRSLLQKRIDKGKMDAEAARVILERIQTTTDYAALSGCELVIEAVFEHRDIKADVTGKADAVMSDDSVFASNTSTLPITGLATKFSDPTRFIGLHFFSPVDRMPLVEVILGEQTSDECTAKALDYVKQIRKTPILVNDSRGFYTSRVFGTYTNEGMALLQDGVNPALIENAARQAGMAVGPLAVSDEVTLELQHKVINQSLEDMGDDYNVPSAVAVVETMYETLERWGKRFGKGFYDYPDGGKKRLWPGLSEHWPLADEQPDVEEVERRLLYIQAIETARCIEEGVLTHPADGDIGSIFGWGFPAWSGGTLSLIETVGVSEFVAECDRMASEYGPRFEVPPALRALAESGGTYYSTADGADRSAA